MFQQSKHSSQPRGSLRQPGQQHAASTVAGTPHAHAWHRGLCWDPLLPSPGAAFKQGWNRALPRWPRKQKGRGESHTRSRGHQWHRGWQEESRCHQAGCSRSPAGSLAGIGAVSGDAQIWVRGKRAGEAEPSPRSLDVIFAGAACSSRAINRGKE